MEFKQLFSVVGNDTKIPIYLAPKKGRRIMRAVFTLSTICVGLILYAAIMYSFILFMCFLVPAALIGMFLFMAALMPYHEGDLGTTFNPITKEIQYTWLTSKRSDIVTSVADIAKISNVTEVSVAGCIEDYVDEVESKDTVPLLKIENRIETKLSKLSIRKELDRQCQ